MPTSDCALCEGTGWKPLEADGVRRMVPCECFQTERAARLLRAARIPRRYEHCAFENFDVLRVGEGKNRQKNPTLEAAKLIAQRFVEEYPTEVGILFAGPCGVGKTHLAVAVLRELMVGKGIECLFYDFRELLKEIQASYDPIARTSELRILQPVLDVEVLLLDELGAANPTDWVKETLAHLINTRYNQKKVTLITTTYTEPAEKRNIKLPSGETLPEFEWSLAQLGPTMCSRLYEMCRVVEIHAHDFRKTVRQASIQHGEQEALRSRRVKGS